MKSNKVISKIVASTLLCSMVGYTLPVFAYTKDDSGNNNEDKMFIQSIDIE